MGKNIVLAFFLVVAIKSNLSTFAAAKVQKLGIRNVECGIILIQHLFGELLESFFDADVFFL